MDMFFLFAEWFLSEGGYRTPGWPAKARHRQFTII
jgi:hypothetical protein